MAKINAVRKGLLKKKKRLSFYFRLASHRIQEPRGDAQIVTECQIRTCLSW